MPKIDIVSHPLCPFAHRLVLIGTIKGLKRGGDFGVTYLAYPTLAQTVGPHSPTGDLPVLKIDGRVRTTSAIHAAEYLDALAPPPLLPAEPSERLKVREREQKIGQTLQSMRGMFTAQTAEALEAALAAVFGHLDDIDRDLGDDGANDAVDSMDMAALAPVFSLLDAHAGLRGHARWEAIPRLRRIGRRLAADPLVAGSRCPDHHDEFTAFFAMTKSVFPQHLAA